MLADGDVSKEKIYNAVVKAGISIEALRRAKGSLKICAIVTEGGSVWRQPRYREQTKPTLDLTDSDG